MAIQQAEQDAEADRLVVLSDVWLDKPDILDSLHTIFAGGLGILVADFCWHPSHNMYHTALHAACVGG